MLDDSTVDGLDPIHGESIVAHVGRVVGGNEQSSFQEESYGPHD